MSAFPPLLGAKRTFPEASRADRTARAVKLGAHAGANSDCHLFRIDY